MERSLDPELLALALGNHENMPSTEQLSELIVKAELGLLQRKPDFDNELIRDGWYLHAIGSSKYALQTYGIERQRGAFQVSAHIFDLFLQSSEELDHLEKLKFSFASQVAYIKSQLDPNSIAIHNKISPNLRFDLNISEDFQEMALSTAVALLGMNADYIYKNFSLLNQQITQFLKEWEVVNIFATPFGAASGVVLGARDLISYLIYGNEENLNRAKELFNSSIRSESSFDDQISRWIAAHLLNLSDDLKNASIWTVLPPNIPSSFRRAFSMAHPKILTLWPPQIQLFSENMAKGINPLSPDVKRLFLSTPTSGGKTLLAQLLILSHLVTEGTSVCYVAPTRSLCREVAASLEKRIRYLGKNVSSELPEGDWLDHIIDEDVNVEVMTPERLSFLLHSDSNQFLQKFGMFIFDEVHTIGELGRGWTLEEDLTFLQYATEGKNHRITFISAAVGNKVHFVEWLGKNGDEVVHLSSDWRGPRRLYTIWRTESDWDAVKIETPPKQAKYEKRLIYPLYGRLDTLLPHSKKFVSYKTDESIGQLAVKADKNNKLIKNGKINTHSTPFYKMLVPIIHHLALSGPVLVINSTISGTINLAKIIAEDLEPKESPHISQLTDMVNTKLGEEHSLYKILPKGVAYHHGSLPLEIRTSIEDAVGQGQINILVATTTMTEGVNLPVKSVVIASQGSFTNEGDYVEFINGPKLVNAIGRAGRAAKETEGTIVLALNNQVSVDDFKKFTPDPSDMEVISNLAAQSTLEYLSKFEETIREHEDAIFSANHLIISKFLSFVWYFASEMEKNNSDINQADIQNFLSKTLAWSQLSEENQKKWLILAYGTITVYKKTDAKTRLRWGKSGTYLGTSQELEKISQTICDEVMALKTPISITTGIDLLLSDKNLETILGLPEAPKKVFFTTRSGERAELALPIRDMVREWVDGKELGVIADLFFNQIIDVDYRFEQLGEFTSKYFENFIPWILGTIINWSNVLLQDKNANFLIPKTIPAHIRWGVNNITALELMSKGITSRRLANVIGEEWEGSAVEIKVHTWLRQMDVEEWKKRFDPSLPELRTLLEFSKARNNSVAVNLITKGTATISIKALIDNLEPSYAEVRQVDQSLVSPLGVWVNKTLVGEIASRDQSDIQSLLNTGLFIELICVIKANQGTLELNLHNPE